MVESSAHRGTPRNVLVLHSEPLVRDALRSALSATDELVCSGVEPQGDVSAVDAVLVGFDWLDGDAVAELHRLRDRYPDATMVAVVRTADEQQVTAAVGLGATVVPTTAPLRVVLDGLRGRDDATPGAWRVEAARRASAARLSPRELDVLRLTADGLPADAVARRLGITSHTCRDHLKRLRAKLGCVTTLQVVVTAARLGILPGFGSGRALVDAD
jgi:two-component system response regulator DesR